MQTNPYMKSGAIVTTDGGNVSGVVVENDGVLPVVQWEDCEGPVFAPFASIEFAPPAPSPYELAMDAEANR